VIESKDALAVVANDCSNETYRHVYDDQPAENIVMFFARVTGDAVNITTAFCLPNGSSSHAVD
jgi:hypothetical protein